MRRVLGHRRPLGTTTRVRMDWSPDSHDPEIGDITREQESARWYLVVGVEEHRDSPRVWWVTLERISEEQALDKLRASDQGIWEHVRYRR